MYNKSILTGCLLLLAVMLAGCSQPPTSKPNHMITCTWNKLPDLPGMADTASLGVSAPFVGISNGMLLVAGGCNFPDKPVTEGGAKRYYSDIFALDLSDKNAQWQKAGNHNPPGREPRPPASSSCLRSLRHDAGRYRLHRGKQQHRFFSRCLSAVQVQVR